MQKLQLELRKQAGSLHMRKVAEVLHKSDARRSIEHLQTMFAGSSTSESLDVCILELAKIGSQVTVEVEAAFLELVESSTPNAA